MELSTEQKAALEEQKKSCIFCKIVACEIPSKKVFEDDLVLAVLDINPARKGHMLVLPKEHYPIMPLIPQKTFEHLFLRVKDLADCANKSLLSQGTTVFIANGGAAGQQSQHFLLHIIPREKADGLDKLDIPTHEIPLDEIKRLREKIANSLPLLVQNHYQRTDQKYPGKTRIPKERLIGIIESNPPLLDVVLKQPEEFKKLVPNHPQLKDLFADQNIDAILAEVFLKHGKMYPPKPSKAPAPAVAPEEPIEAEFEDTKEEPEKTGRTEGRTQKGDDGEDNTSDENEEDVFAALGGIAKDDEDESEEDNHEESEDQGKTVDRHDDNDEKGGDETDEEDEKVDLDDIANLFK